MNIRCCISGSARIALCAAAIGSAGASAGQVFGHVESIEYARQCTSAWNGCVFVSMSVATTRPAPCSTAANARTMVLDPNINASYREQHRWMLRAIESAYVTGADIYLIGAGECAIQGGVESVKAVSAPASR